MRPRRANSYRKRLILVIGGSIAVIAGMWIYAVSLEEWGEVRSVIFTFGGMIALITAFAASLLLLVDLIRRRQS